MTKPLLLLLDDIEDAFLLKIWISRLGYRYKAIFTDSIAAVDFFLIQKCLHYKALIIDTGSKDCIYWKLIEQIRNTKGGEQLPLIVFIYYSVVYDAKLWDYVSMCNEYITKPTSYRVLVRTLPNVLSMNNSEAMSASNKQSNIFPHDTLKQYEEYKIVSAIYPILKNDTVPEISFELHSLKNFSEPIFLGETKNNTNISGFLKYLHLLKIPVNQASYLRIVEAFDFMHPWEQVIQNIGYFDETALIVSKKNRSKIESYNKVIHPVEFQIFDKEGKKIVFWTGDIKLGHLKRWVIFTDDNGKVQIEEEIVERHFFAVAV